MHSKKLTKFITGTVVASIVFATGFTTFAAQRNKNPGTVLNNVNNVVSTDQTRDGRGFGKGGSFTSILAEMVKDGTLTQSEADKITAYQKEKQKSMKAEMEKVKKMTDEEKKNYFSTRKEKGQDLLTELVNNGIITQTKADAIKARVLLKNQEMKAARLNEIKNQLSTLVTKGTINQTQADKVIEYLNQNEGRKCKLEKNRIDQTEREKIKNMTEEERKAYFEKIRGEKGNFLKELVDNGTLTQEQANEISKVIRPQHEAGIKGN